NISSVKNVPILDDQQKITYLEEGCFGRTESEQNDELIPLLEKNLIVEHELIQQLSTTINNDENHVTSRIESTESSSQAYIPPGLKAISDKKMNTLDTSQAR
ncbi:14165_t:CDS:2, partial [Dentiscutata heterogama]